MTGQELLTSLREDILDDAELPYLWKDTTLLRYLNYAEVQACRRGYLIIDGSTSNDSGTAGTAGTLGQKPLCTLSLVPGQAVYNLSPKILQVKRCQLASLTYPLQGPLSYFELDELVSGWKGTGGVVGTAGTGGYPFGFLNEPNDTITFIQAPFAADTAYLVVSRLPLMQFSLGTSPEIEEKHHDGLLDWAAHLAYMRNDSDSQNLNLAQIHENKFTQRFGPLPEAKAERLRKTLSQNQRMRSRAFGS